MRNKWLPVALAALVLGLAGVAHAAGDVDEGMAKAKRCAACHGADGKGRKDNPPLAGMDPEKFTKAMAEYKEGARDHKMMTALAKKLSDEDIANLAAYYASLK
jgi:cytochrome c553